MGAVNCQKYAALCQSFDVGSYPTVRMVSAKYNLHQDAHGAGNAGPAALAEWAAAVRREWAWLFANADVTALTVASFERDGGWRLCVCMCVSAR